PSSSSASCARTRDGRPAMTALQAPVRGRALAGGDGDARSSAMRRWWIYAPRPIGLLLMVGPFLWMLLGSLKPQAEFLISTPKFLPKKRTHNKLARLFGKLELQSI